MAQFRGTIEGQRGQASRLGSKASGLTVEAQSWEGKIVTYLYHDDASGRDMARVTMEQHHSRGEYPSYTIYEGPVGSFMHASEPPKHASPRQEALQDPKHFTRV